MKLDSFFPSQLSDCQFSHASPLKSPCYFRPVLWCLPGWLLSLDSSLKSPSNCVILWQSSEVCLTVCYSRPVSLSLLDPVLFHDSPLKSTWLSVIPWYPPKVSLTVCYFMPVSWSLPESLLHQTSPWSLLNSLLLQDSLTEVSLTV